MPSRISSCKSNRMVVHFAASRWTNLARYERKSMQAWTKPVKFRNLRWDFLP